MSRGWETRKTLGSVRRSLNYALLQATKLLARGEAVRTVPEKVSIGVRRQWGSVLLFPQKFFGQSHLTHT